MNTDSITLSPNKYHRAIAFMYLFSGIIAALQTVSALDGASLGLLDLIIYSALIAQIAFSIYGGWMLWRNQALGLQILYYVSLSCIPAFSLSFITYWSVLGVGITPVIQMSSGYFGFNFNINFIYASQLSLFNGGGFMVGTNLFASFIATIIRKQMIKLNIKPWQPQKIQAAPTMQ